ncbi:GATA zinc finger domain-containing protein 10 [Galendromus occidentalis]|uniref:GATA zinc finger domain-containing protein 10 n=1 Tax=Galendromus occidentalis TaxID=34638 RepID=A0AAJ7PBE7_9ACAR|nr:GATA zinc finger domain-containing protein 10 [Galendromus occidentalis]
MEASPNFGAHSAPGSHRDIDRIGIDLRNIKHELADMSLNDHIGSVNLIMPGSADIVMPSTALVRSASVREPQAPPSGRRGRRTTTPYQRRIDQLEERVGQLINIVAQQQQQHHQQQQQHHQQQQQLINIVAQQQQQQRQQRRRRRRRLRRQRQQQQQQQQRHEIPSELVEFVGEFDP